MNQLPPIRSRNAGPEKILAAVAIAAWAGLFVVLGVQTALHPDRGSVFTYFYTAGVRWLGHSQIYFASVNKGFVYSPFAAECYGLVAWLPQWLAGAAWRLASGALFLGGLWSLLRSGLFPAISTSGRFVVLLLALPLCAYNFEAGHSNPFVIAAMMLAASAFAAGRWNWCAAAIAVATHWKIYPITFGLLLLLIEPRKLWWRLPAAIAIMALVPFLTAPPEYVASIYSEWIRLRLADNRFEYPLDLAPLDLWFVLVKWLHLPLPLPVYAAMRVLSGAGIAALILFGAFRGRPRAQLLKLALFLGCTWAILFGPATEGFTYALIAPLASLALVETFSARSSRAAVASASICYGLLVFAVLRQAFFHQIQSEILLSAQPVAAIALTVCAIQQYAVLSPNPQKSAPASG